jgi:hypothetical protein
VRSDVGLNPALVDGDDDALSVAFEDAAQGIERGLEGILGHGRRRVRPRPTINVLGVGRSA